MPTDTTSPPDERIEDEHRTIILNDSVEIARSPEDVYAYLLDVSSDPVWQKGLHEARYTSSGPVRVGTTGVHIARPFGLRVEVAWRLTDVVDQQHLAWTFIDGPFTGGESYTLTPTAMGTLLAHRAELHPHGLLRVLRPLIAGSFITQSERNMHTLKDLLEQGRDRM